MRRLLPLIIVLLIALAAASSYLIILRRGGGWRLEIYIDGERKAAYRLETLKGLSEAITIESCGGISAIPLLGLLGSSGVDLDRNIVSSITPYGSDGYHRTVEEAYLYLFDAYIQIVEENIADYGPLRIVIAGLPRKYWVHHLVKIDVKLESWRLTLLMDGAVKKSWSVEELSAMPKVSITLNGEEAEVIPLTSLMEAAGIKIGEETTIRAISTYGASVTLSSVDIPHVYVLVIEGSAISDFGRLRLFSPGGLSLDHLVALEVSG
ncbi:hypothetical protein J7L65_06415 [Candidatus Bathyarchaeota archaeon]|nr:hypothetical protein [Candidatus Bathyarchaeota archaeon]